MTLGVLFVLCFALGFGLAAAHRATRALRNENRRLYGRVAELQLRLVQEQERHLQDLRELRADYQTLMNRTREALGLGHVEPKKSTTKH